MERNDFIERIIIARDNYKNDDCNEGNHNVKPMTDKEKKDLRTFMENLDIEK